MGPSALIRIEAPTFVAGIELLNGVAFRAAPILKYTVGWSQDRILKYASSKRWTVSVS